MSNKSPIFVLSKDQTILKEVKNLGYLKVLSADNMDDAEEILEEKDVSIIICGWETSDGKGLEFARRIRTNTKLKNIPFIIVIPANEKNHTVTAIKAGVSDFILEPMGSKLSDKISKFYHT